MEESQRSSMFNAWKKREIEKQSKCKHQWNTVEPIRCMKCAKFKNPR